MLHFVQQLSLLGFLLCGMFGAGLGLTPAAVLAPLRDARLVISALALNFLFAPAFAWVLTQAIPLQRGHAIGLMLLSGAAGAPFLPKLAQAARCDAGLAVSLMALLTAVTILFLPLGLPLLIPGFTANAWAIARPLLLLILLPLCVGMLVRSRAGRFAARVAPIFEKIGTGSLLLLFALAVALNFPALRATMGSGAILAAILYVLGLFATGWALAPKGPTGRGDSGLALAARNFGAALVPAAESFDDPAVVVMLVVNAIVGVIVLFAIAALLRRRKMGTA